MAKYCSNCGAEVKGKFCEECGHPIGEENKLNIQSTSNISTPIYQPKKKKKKHGCLIGIAIFIAIITVISVSITNEYNNEQDEITNKLTKLTSIEEKEAKNIIKVLEECGVNNINDVTSSQYKKGKVKACNILSDDGTIKVFYENSKLKEIIYEDNVLYKNGKKKLDISEIINPVDTEHMIQYSINVSEKESKKILKVLEKCLITNITEANFKKYNKEKNKVYKLPVDYGNVYITIKKGKLQTVKFEEKTLYKNNKVIATINDYVVTEQERFNLITECTEIVKNTLKSPSSAKFPSDSKWSVGKKDDKTYVQGYVDADNSFGANIRSEFQFTIKNNSIISFIFDGKEMLE